MNINNSKKVWNGIKEIVHFKSKTSQKIIKIVQNNVKLTAPKLVINAFNNYFANVGVNLARLILNVNKSRLEYLKNPSCPFRSPDELFLVVRSYSIYEVTTF